MMTVRSCSRATAHLAAVLLALTGTLSVHAQSPTERQLIEALGAKATRSAAPAATTNAATGKADAAKAERVEKLLDSLKTKGTRAFSVKERAEIAAVAASQPSIDMEVQFDFNSAVVGPKAAEMLDTLGRALSSPELKGGTFMVAGHTDAKGKASVNQAMSQRRAEAVRDYLATKHQLDKANLVAVGYGKERLKNQKQPFAAENRRVQIVNLTTRQAQR